MASSIYTEKKIGYYESTFKVGSGKPQDVNITITAEHIYGLGYIIIRKGTIEGDAEYTRFTCSLDEITKVAVNAVNKKNISLHVYCDIFEKGVMYCRRVIIPCLKNAREAAEEIETAKAQYLEKMQKSKERAKALEAAKQEAEEEAKNTAEEAAAEAQTVSEEAVLKPEEHEKVSLEDLLHLNDVMDTDINEPVYYRSNGSDYEEFSADEENKDDNGSDMNSYNAETADYQQGTAYDDVQDTDEGTAVLTELDESSETDTVSGTEDVQTDEIELPEIRDIGTEGIRGGSPAENIVHEDISVPELGDIGTEDAQGGNSETPICADEVPLPEVEDIKEPEKVTDETENEEVAVPETEKIEENPSVLSTSQLKETVEAPETESMNGADEENEQPESVMPSADESETEVITAAEPESVSETVGVNQTKDDPVKFDKSMSLEDFQNSVLKLKSMLDAGVISREEFDAEKKKMLSSLY